MQAVFRAAFGYLFLVFIVRVVGRRPGKQMAPFEYVLIFFIGGLMLTGIVGPEASLTNAFTQIITIALTHYALVWARSKWNRFARVSDGTPLVLLEHGQWRSLTMGRMRISADDVMTAARDKGLGSLDLIRYAILERNGEISIIKKDDES
jgi:uncharacterized membrane protein YcaP (DUF421 family)